MKCKSKAKSSNQNKMRRSFLMIFFACYMVVQNRIEHEIGGVK